MTEILDETLLQTLECPICTEIYEMPKQLICGHTYCNQCIESLINQAKHNPPLFGLGGQSQNPFSGRSQLAIITCPECRLATRIPQNGLPPNYRLQDYTEKYRSLLTDYMRCVCGQWCKVDNIFYCDTCYTEENGPEKILLCGTCALTNHSMHSHSVQKFKGVSKENRKHVADKLKFTEKQLKLKLDNVMRKGDHFKEIFMRVYENLYPHYNSFCQVSEEIIKRTTLNQLELDSKVAVSEKRLIIWNDIFNQIDKIEADISEHLSKFVSTSAMRLTTLDEVDIPNFQEEDRSCDVSSSGRDAELNLNNLVLNDQEQQKKSPESKASVFTYKPESSKPRRCHKNLSIRKKVSFSPSLSSNVSSTLPCISRSVSSITFSMPTVSGNSSTCARAQTPPGGFPPSPGREIPFDTDDQTTSDASL